jgi:hypothetical protein
MNKEKSCYKCQYRGNVPGDAHSCCQYPGTKTGMLDFFEPENFQLMDDLHIKANAHGVKMGWFMWPVNFDPTWLENCDGFKAKEEGQVQP